MRKLLIGIIAVMLMFSIGGGVAQAEYTFPGDGFNKGTMGTEAKPFREFWGNTVGFEGATPNAFETYLSAVEPTGVNRITLPDESGELITNCSDSVFTNSAITNGADGRILISNDVGTGTVIWATHTLTGDVTGTMINSGAADTTIAASVVGTNEANINSVALVIGSGSTWNSVVVESGSTLMGWYITNVGAITGESVNAIYMNTVEWDGSIFKATLNTSGAAATEVTGTFLRP